MKIVRKTGAGEWVVCESYNGNCLAGPFPTRGDAYDAMDGKSSVAVKTEPAAKRGPGRPPKAAE